jgi:hypothetical protein
MATSACEKSSPLNNSGSRRAGERLGEAVVEIELDGMAGTFAANRVFLDWRRHRERSDAIQGNAGRLAFPGLLRRSAPRNDGSD